MEGHSGQLHAGRGKYGHIEKAKKTCKGWPESVIRDRETLKSFACHF